MKQARVLSRDELKRVLAICASTKHGQRNRLALLLSHYAGLRVGEIAALSWNQLVDGNGQIVGCFYLHAQHTKSHEARAVHVNEMLRREIMAYQASCYPTHQIDGPVIASQKYGAFSPNSLCQLFGRLYSLAGIDGASSHSGRRWFITKLAHAGVSAKVIMELAGHKNLGTTQRYIEVNEELKQRAVEILLR